MAKTRRLSNNRIILELIVKGLEAEKQEEEQFFELAGRFRSAEDPEEVKRLGERLGRMVFGEQCPRPIAGIASPRVSAST